MAGMSRFKTISALIVIFAIAGAAAQDAQIYGKSDWELDGLRGRVKQVEAEYWRVGGLGSMGGPEELSLDMRIITRFDEGGYRRAEEYWVGGQELSYVDLWDYGPDGRLLSKRAENPRGEEMGRDEAAWDGSGNLLSWTSLMDDGSVDRKRVYRYASAGQPSEMIEYQGRGEALLRVAWTWDGAGRMLERLSEEPPGFPVRREIRKYDEGGRLVEVLLYGGDGRQRSWTIISWDERGIKKEERECDPDGTVLSRMEYLYDDKGLLTQTLGYGDDGGLHSKSRILYDAYGNALEHQVWELRQGPGAAKETLRTRSTYAFEYWD